jgi:CxxC motif-containing protein (DUF1111 family)
MAGNTKNPRRTSARWFGVVAWGFLALSTSLLAQIVADPGPRTGAAGAGGPIAGLTVKEGKFFDAGLEEFEEIQSVTETADTEGGLGPRFNLNSCAGCHSQPAVGGTSPATNPQTDAQVFGGGVTTQSQIDLLSGLGIISRNGPVREVRFTTDGGVHDLFTIVGLPGTPTNCNISQPNFTAATNAGITRFRIPTPTFGLGLIEAIEDAVIAANVRAGKPFGILGSVNRNDNDGTITRFGWKAQNKSLVIFSGEAYNVEQGITNELFPDERGEGGVQDPIACRRVVEAPQDTPGFEESQPQQVLDNVNAFANFMRFLAPPVQVSSYVTDTGITVTSTQIAAGEAAFNRAGCVVCHRKSMATGFHITEALQFKTANLFSDLLLHDVGTGDGIAQGRATGAQFRTAPLWGLGQRLFFLHDGRTDDLVDAINAHGGEATRVINNFNGVSVGDDAAFNLTAAQRLNLLRFLRSL